MSRDRKSFSGRRDNRNREESRGNQNRNKFEKRDRPSAPKKFYKNLEKNVFSDMMETTEHKIVF